MSEPLTKLENLAKNKATFSKPVKVAKEDINAVENEDAAEKSLIESKEELTVICGVCNTAFYNVVDCEKHMDTHPSRCFKCDFQSENQKPERTESAPIS